MKFPLKEVVCDCGHPTAMQKRYGWCINCGKRMYYDAKDRRMGKLRHHLVLAAILSVLGFLTYVFVEFLVKLVF